MKERKKIILNSTSLNGETNEDMYLNVKLRNSRRDFTTDSYDNIFDVQGNFDKERNSSFNFTVYGIISSAFYDITSPDIDNGSQGSGFLLYKEIKDPESLSKVENLKLGTGYTSQDIDDRNDLILENGAKVSFVRDLAENRTLLPLGLDGYNRNVFGKRINGYKFDIDNIDYETIYIYLQTNSDQIGQFNRLQLVYYDENGDLIDFGNDTQEIGFDGSVTDVFNDYPFFYNRHYVKYFFEYFGS